MTQHTDLAEAGWQLTRSGKWWHPGLPTTDGRRRLFTTAQAATILNGDPAHPATRHATEA